MPYRPVCLRFHLIVILVLCGGRRLRAGDGAIGRATDHLATVAEMVAAREDLWAEAALREPGEPSYAFFRDLLPPLFYVNADFRIHPIILAAPAAPEKVRRVADGSALNAHAHQRPMWRKIGTPVPFPVGVPGEDFGDDPARLDGPRDAEGGLPMCASPTGARRSATSRRPSYLPLATWPTTGPSSSGSIPIGVPRTRPGLISDQRTSPPS